MGAGSSQTFAPVGIDIVGAVGAVATGFLALALHAGPTPPGFSERRKLQLVAVLITCFSLGLLFLCTALGNHHTGHSLMAGKWIPTGLWLAQGIANVATVYNIGMAFAALEHYAWIASGLQACVSIVLYAGAYNTDQSDKIPLAMSIIGFALQFAVFLYGYYYLTPSAEWQTTHGGAFYTICRAVFLATFFAYPALYTADVTFKNNFHGHELTPWALYLTFAFLLHYICNILCIWYFAPEPSAPAFSWLSGVGKTMGGAYAPQQVQEQQFAPSGQAPPVSNQGNEVSYDGFQFRA